MEYQTNFVPFNVARFGQPFVDRVANPSEILLFSRKKKSFRPHADGLGKSSRQAAEEMDEDLEEGEGGERLSMCLAVTY